MLKNYDLNIKNAFLILMIVVTTAAAATRAATAIKQDWIKTQGDEDEKAKCAHSLVHCLDVHVLANRRGHIRCARESNRGECQEQPRRLRGRLQDSFQHKRKRISYHGGHYQSISFLQDLSSMVRYIQGVNCELERMKYFVSFQCLGECNIKWFQSFELDVTVLPKNQPK